MSVAGEGRNVSVAGEGRNVSAGLHAADATAGGGPRVDRSPVDGAGEDALPGQGASEATALACRGVTVALQAREVLHGIDLAFPAGRWTCIVGPNGAGKSTLLRTLAGLQPHAGEVRLLGRKLADWPSRERARRLCWLGQNESAADDLTVYDVAMLGRVPHRGWLAPPGPADRAAVEEALRATHAWAWRDRLLGRLSGGERQRVLLARALAVQAPVLLMDEPLANLDPPHQADWLALARALVAAGRTVVSVLHEITFALQADALVVMDAGRVLHHGACAAPATHEALAQVFAGRLQVRTVDGLRVAVPTIG